jgi:hypothetical protein
MLPSRKHILSAGIDRGALRDVAVLAER